MYCERHSVNHNGICVLCYNESHGSIATVVPLASRVAVSDAPDKAEALLHEALTIVTGARRQAYGNPEDNFTVIADLWSTYLRRLGVDFTDPESKLSASTVAVMMMILMKCARLAETPNHHDSAVDVAGYAACLARCQEATK